MRSLWKMGHPPCQYGWVGANWALLMVAQSMLWDGWDISRTVRRWRRQGKLLGEVLVDPIWRPPAYKSKGFHMASYSTSPLSASAELHFNWSSKATWTLISQSPVNHICHFHSHKVCCSFIILSQLSQATCVLSYLPSFLICQTHCHPFVLTYICHDSVVLLYSAPACHHCIANPLKGWVIPGHCH